MTLQKNLFNFFAIPFLLVAFSFLTAKSVSAAEFHFKGYTLAQDQTVNDDVYASGDTVDIKGVINGDLFVAGQTVNISGTISGDVYAVGSDINFSGNAYQNVFMTGNNVTLSGNIKGDIYTAGAVVNSTAQIEKDLLVVSGSNNLKGTVTDDIRIVSNKTSVETIVGGELISISRTDNIEKNKVSGNIYDWSTIKGIAQAQGVNFNSDQRIAISKAKTNSINLLGALVSFIGLGLAGYFLITLSPVKTGKVISKITGSTGNFVKSFGVGLLIAVLIPLPLILFFVSVFGIYVGLLILGLLMFFCIFGRIWVEVAFGQEILSLFKVKGYRPFKSLLVGRLLSVVLSFIPILGGIYSCVLYLTSIGAFTRMKLDYLNASKKKK